MLKKLHCALLQVLRRDVRAARDAQQGVAQRHEVLDGGEVGGDGWWVAGNVWLAVDGG